MTVVKKTNLEIGAGVNLDGSRKTTSYPIETHDNSGLHAENDHIFTGEIAGVKSGNAPVGQPSTPPHAVTYQQANHTPQGMDNSPNPPKGSGSSD
jgi:hypothetical protein